MALKALPMGLALALAAVLVATQWMGASAQSSGCTSALVSLSPCLNYITGNESTPSSSCCSQLASVVQSEPQCLCTVLNGGASSLGITVNQTQALALPGACKVQTPPVSRCNGNGGAAGNGGSPANGGPTGSTPATPSAGTPAVYVPPGVGSKTYPAGGVEFSDASSAQMPLTALIFSLLVAVAFAAASPTSL